MKTTRKNLLQTALSTGENVNLIVTATTKKDSSFLKRTKQELENKIEDLNSELEIRLSSQIPLDKSTVENTYASIKEAETTLALYKSFEKEFITEGE